MKILHVTPAYEPAWHYGGVVRSVSQYCRGLASLGHEVTVFTSEVGVTNRADLLINSPVNVGGVQVFYFKTNLGFKFGYSTHLRNALRRDLGNYDIVHITSLWWYPEIATWVEATKQKIPYIISATGGLSEYSLSQKPIKKNLYLKLVGRKIIDAADAVHYKTDLEREQARHLDIKTPSFVIPGGINLEEFTQLLDKITARKEMAIPNDSLVILFLGRLHPVKNLDILIKAFAEVQHKFSKLVLIIAGPDDGQLALLKKLASELGVSAKVFFPGLIDPDKRNSMLRCADLLALLSFHENFGNSAIEAMLAGIPVLLSDKVGICRETVADGAGLAVDLNEEAIARGLREMLGNPEKLAAMGQAAWDASRRRYDIKVVAEQMATAYQDILTGKRSLGLSWSDAPSGPRK